MILSLLGEALAAMAANRLRTFLTALGILIGVAAVVLMVAIGQGTQKQVGDSIASMGSNLLIVRSGAPNKGGVHGGSGNMPTLTVMDAQAIGQLARAALVAPTVMGSVQLVYGPNNWNTTATGTSADYLNIRSWQLAAGRGFTESEAMSGVRVALIGQEVANQLFGDDNPLGKSIRVQRTPFTVIGLLDAKGQSMGGQNQDDMIIVPLATAQRQLFGSQFQGTVSMVMIQARSPEDMSPLEKSIRELLRQRHHLGVRADDDFRITNMTEVSETASQVTGMLSILLGAIASISLFVGGIGIMNIMMVSVTERTREIGIRMAIGASRRDILLQFLLESVIITMAGGIAGIAVGIGLALGVTRVFDVWTAVTAMPVLLAFGVSVAVGIFFGLYPARKASLMRPIDALRYQG
ncbi:MAG: multidrug ABC transporter substrate-binding protein [Zetaproteobacteria bacterium CG12_big_fil_rev_8_21_14_0_65_55_1124]|nr:MAG: multidrug ABC transporter substrate-binding protein [Zetaproteobacteria bacterium CG1_02_55_237]PIS19358.1 MAG: multidrug ABC transporter substrate-binding protein [Zetaproteobacteria bacterium CG08_land_8_20_14_0_20_55_17]PIW43404.1 MAG: multidrug ABC transporter substrate-binding protein [Zetaproteobacteria bacterium CG12_big_fil_rev_8_21_14_0_65_55_1124]PIY53599.1 MAG: multidrug ABC transporter substrate-binding protein [Zetaproteobacteria bacterium CG_4_10_14_0_8_um_filter_55_43]PIZ